MAFTGTWKKESVTGAEAFFAAYDPKPENKAKLERLQQLICSPSWPITAHHSKWFAVWRLAGKIVTLGLVSTQFSDAKTITENLITFGQESDLTGPLGNTFKVRDDTFKNTNIFIRSPSIELETNVLLLELFTRISQSRWRSLVASLSRLTPARATLLSVPLANKIT